MFLNLRSLKYNKVITMIQSLVRKLLNLQLTLILSVVAMEAQPLQFWDEASSLQLKDLRTYTTTDSGWVIIGHDYDNEMFLAKFNQCGKMLFSRSYRKPDFKLDQLICAKQSLQSSEILIGGLFSTPQESGVQLYMTNDADLFLSKPVSFSLPGLKVYQNPVVQYLGSTNRILLSFNAGPDSSNMSGYLVSYDENFTIRHFVKLDSNRQIRGLVPFNSNFFFVNVDERTCLGLNDSLRILFSYQLDSNYTHVDRLHLTTGISGIFGGKYRNSGGSEGLCLLQLDDSLHLVRTNQSAFQFDARYQPRLIQLEGDILLAYIKREASGAPSFTTVRYNRLLVQRRYHSILRKTGQIQLVCFDIAYGDRESNFILAGSMDLNRRYFHGKLATDFFLNDTSCIYVDYEDPNSGIFGFNNFRQDSLSGIVLTVEPSFTNNSSVGVPDLNFEYRYDRVCSYFDFMGGTGRVQGCVGDQIQIQALPKKYANLDFANRSVRYCWFPDIDPVQKTNNTISIIVPRDPVIVRTYYCEDSIDFKYLISELPCISFPNIFLPASDDPVNKDFNPIYKSDTTGTNHINNISKVKFDIYNRWGKKIFTASDPNAKWDGNYEGEPAPMDSYIYTLEVFYKNNEIRNFKGVFSLVR